MLTNWERLADFVPNLESCERLPSPRPGRVRRQRPALHCCCCAGAAACAPPAAVMITSTSLIADQSEFNPLRACPAPPALPQTWIRQRGCSQGVLWRLEAEAVIEVEEARLPLGRREARFSMIEGDFKASGAAAACAGMCNTTLLDALCKVLELASLRCMSLTSGLRRPCLLPQEMSGRWVMEPDPSSAVGMATLLRFDISVRVSAGCAGLCPCPGGSAPRGSPSAHAYACCRCPGADTSHLS